MPEHHARRFFLPVEQIQGFTYFTVITLFSFFQALQVSFQLFLVCPGCTINTLQHFVVAVTTPVGTRHFHQFEMLTELHVRHMRTTTHIDVFFVVIQARERVFRNVLVENFHFIGFAAGFKSIPRFLPANVFLHYVVVSFGQLQHPLFKLLQIFLRQAVFHIHIVIKAVVDSRTDCHLCIRP